MRDLHDRLSILRRDIASAIALFGGDTLAGVRLRGALDVVDDLLRELERFGITA